MAKVITCIFSQLHEADSQSGWFTDLIMAMLEFGEYQDKVVVEALLRMGKSGMKRYERLKELVLNYTDGSEITCFNTECHPRHHCPSQT